MLVIRVSVVVGGVLPAPSLRSGQALHGVGSIQAGEAARVGQHCAPTRESSDAAAVRAGRPGQW